MNQYGKSVGALLLICCCVAVNSYLCDQWCPYYNGINCCDSKSNQPWNPPKPGNSQCIFEICNSTSPRDTTVEECNRFIDEKKCPDGELCCPDDCAQKFICKVENGRTKQCPSRKCIPSSSESAQIICRIDRNQCGRGELCCPDDCTSTFICRKAEYV